ncbi:MAG: CBS domain-containing protein [Candidatus Levybacteria bacterium]|nr:CBS domain-containing protein [Candidatus Levybacteria bacterium]
MKVADAMSRQVDYVSLDARLKDVAKLIFGRGVNGVPVVDNKKKLIGFVTEKDILSKFYPSMQEYVEDPFHSSDFEIMEGKIDEILEMPVDRIMSKNPVTVNANTPLLKAQSIMFVEKVGRLPVVDKENKLVGIISKGDIFKVMVGEKLPLEEDEKFHDWLSRRYDLIIDQKVRLSKEIPDLTKKLKDLNVKTIIDIGCGTGVHTVALAQEGFEVLGMDRSSRMIDEARMKLKSFSKQVYQKIKFISKDYKNLDKLLDERFDAVIFMGSALAHVEDPQQTLKEVSKILNNNAVVICQITNYEKVLKLNKGFMDFNIRNSPHSNDDREAFLRFFDEGAEGFLSQNVSVFTRISKKWTFRGLRSMRVYHLTKDKITSFLKNINFSDIKYYGGEKGFFYDNLFRTPFKELESDVLTVVARR